MWPSSFDSRQENIICIFCIIFILFPLGSHYVWNTTIIDFDLLLFLFIYFSPFVSFFNFNLISQHQSIEINFFFWLWENSTVFFLFFFFNIWNVGNLPSFFVRWFLLSRYLRESSLDFRDLFHGSDSKMWILIMLNSIVYCSTHPHTHSHTVQVCFRLIM